MCVSQISQVVGYPVEPDSRWFGEAPTYYGPYQYGINLYTIFIVNDSFGDILDTPPTIDLQVFRSTDGGITWNIHATLAHQTVDRFSRSRCAFIQDANVIYYVYLEGLSPANSPVKLALGKYDILTNSFTHSFSSTGPSVISFDTISAFDQMSVSRRCFSATKVGDAIYIGYANTATNSTPAFSGNYHYVKAGMAKYIISTDTWSTATPYSQTGTKVYTFFSIIPGLGCLHTFVYDNELNPLVPGSPQSNERLVYYSLNYDLTLINTEVIATDVLNVEGLQHARPITFSDGGTERLAIGWFTETFSISGSHDFTNPQFIIAEGSNSSSPGFAGVLTLEIDDVDADEEAKFGITQLNQYLLTEAAIYHNSSGYSVFTETLSEGGSEPFISRSWKVDRVAGAWTSCLSLASNTIDISTTWTQQGIGVYVGTTYGDFISWGFVDRTTFEPGGYFYTALIAASINLEVSVSDSMSMSDGPPATTVGTPGQGTIVHTCPDVVVNSAFCADIKTPVDGEISLHDCAETLYSETTQPCLEVLT